MDNLITFINSIYSFPHPVVSYVKVGLETMNDNFMLNSHYEKYFLKKYRLDVVHNEEHIKEIHEVEKLFFENKIPALKSLITIESQNYFFFENNFYTLYPFVTATLIENTKDLNSEQVVSLAENLSKIHLIGKEKMDFTELPRYSDWSPDKFYKQYSILKELISKKEYKEDLDLKVLNLLEKKRAYIDSQKDINFQFNNDHLIHGDYHEKNIFFENNNVKYIFDWEKASVYPRVIELVRSMELMFLTDSFIEANDFTLAKLYLKSYSNVYPISRNELIDGLNTQILKRVSSLWAESEYYLNNRVQGKNLILELFRKIEFITLHKDELVNELVEDF